MKMYASPAWMENRPNAEIAARELNRWCIRRGWMPASGSKYISRMFKGKAFTDRGYFRKVQDEKLQAVDVISYELEPGLLKSKNISPELFRCAHDDCGKSKIKYIIEEPEKTREKGKPKLIEAEVDCWFCGRESGLLPAYLRECGPELRGPSAMLLRTPADGNNWFDYRVGQVEYNILKEEHKRTLAVPEIKITELNLIFTGNPESVREKVPWAGETILKDVQAVGMGEGYAFRWRGHTYTAGVRTQSRAFPDIINEGLARIVDTYFDGTDRTAVLGELWAKIKNADPEELVIEAVIGKEPEEYGDATQPELGIKKAAGFALDRLEEQGVISPREFCSPHSCQVYLESPGGKQIFIYNENERSHIINSSPYYQGRGNTSPTSLRAGRWTSVVLTREAGSGREWLAPYVRVREVRDPRLDWKLLHRKAYMGALAGKAIEKLAGISPEQVNLDRYSGLGRG